MKRALIFSLVTITLLYASIVTAKTIPVDATVKDRTVKTSYLKLPLSFIKNEGQKDKAVLFYEQGSGHATAFTKQGVSLSLARSGKIKGQKSHELVTLAPLNASPFTVEAVDKREGTVNYLIGNDPKSWKTNVPTYGSVFYRNVYPGIDMKFYGTNSQLEYDLIISPNGDPSKVKLSYKGVQKLSLTSHGELEISLKEGSIYQKKPHLYQTINGKKVEVEGKFILADATTYGFNVGPYDKNHPLVIDPTLVYSTYLGGTGLDLAYAIAVDSSGNAYVAGNTNSVDFPTKNAYQGTEGGRDDVFITKLSPSGDSLVYSTYLGGNGYDSASAIAIDSSGNAYVTGYTWSTDFPTKNAYQETNAGGYDAFVAKLSPSGDGLVYSTCLGGKNYDYGYAIAVDSSGNAYATGQTCSTDFPTKNAYQGTKAGSCDVFITKLNSAGKSLVYSTYLGGSSDDYGNAIAVDSSGNAYVVGKTSSTDFPAKNAYQGTNAGSDDAFIAKLGSAGNSLVYSTCLGGSLNDAALAIAVDSSGNAYVAGQTWSYDFPVKNAYQGTKAGPSGGALWDDAFIAKLADSSGSPTLTVTKSGTGSGTVTSSPTGIDCGDTCSASFTKTTKVTLTPTGSTGSAFANWSGACTGTGTCSVTMSADKEVGAVFNTASCTYTLSPATKVFAYSGGSMNITVTAKGSANCPTPEIVNTTDWITTAWGSAFSKTKGTVKVTVPAYTSSSVKRTATLTLGGKSFTLAQTGKACSLALSASTGSVLAAGGSGSFTVTATPADCVWTATGGKSWLTFSAGTGIVTYAAEANTAKAARNGVITVTATLNKVKKTYTVKQAGRK